MPGYAPQRVGAPGSKAPSTHLATYWWGLEEKVAKVILAKSIGQALGCLERCHGACKADERKRLETRHRDCEVQAFRRGAAALCACSAGIDAGDEHKHRYLGRLPEIGSRRAALRRRRLRQLIGKGAGQGVALGRR